MKEHKLQKRRASEEIQAAMVSHNVAKLTRWIGIGVGLELDTAQLDEAKQYLERGTRNGV